MEETTVKIRTIAIATVFALSITLAVAPAQAKHRHHHHKHHGMTMGGSGPSGPGLEAGAPDKTCAGGKGVSNKPAE
jgi:Spy/CpxP family protein refolding chaperone